MQQRGVSTISLEDNCAVLPANNIEVGKYSVNNLIIKGTIGMKINIKALSFDVVMQPCLLSHQLP